MGEKVEITSKPYLSLLIRKYFAEQYDVRKLKNKEAHFAPKNEALKAVLKAKEELEKKKDERSKLDAEIKKLEKDYLNKQAPFIEEIKDCEYGYSATRFLVKS